MARRRQVANLQTPVLTPAEQTRIATLVEPHTD
jgi:hypothetical protein